MKNIIRIAVATIAIGFTAGVANAGHSSSSLVREAHRVVDYADDLKAEVVRHFRHTDEYRHLLNDAAKIRSEAKHIDKLSHHVHSLSDVKHLRADLEDLDDLIHHVADMVEEISHGHGRGGHAHGDTRHVKGLIASMNRSLHIMEAVVASLERRYRHSDHCHDRYEYRSTSNRSSGARIAEGILREVLRHR
ncbi:MAG: hypothetical protein ACI9UA_000957 [Pseudoalteromonas tetraodonis]|jgi:hypothetical protein